MKQTNDYSASHYVRDNPSSLGWIFRKLLRRNAEIDETKEEPDRYHQSNIAKDRRVIGRVAGPEVYTGSSSQRSKPKRETPVVAQEPKKKESKDAEVVAAEVVRDHAVESS